MTSTQTVSGGRASARRFVVSLAIAMTIGASAAAGAGQPASEVTVSEERGLYTVLARFHVPESPSVAFAVLTDFEQIPRFMPDVKRSIVHERSPGRTIVEQEAVARILMFSRRIHLLLEVATEDGVVRFRDASARSFDRYEGAWRLESDRGQTAITYELAAEPAFNVPEFLLSRLLKRDAARMIARLRAEIAERAREQAGSE